MQKVPTPVQMIDHAWAVALNRAQKAGILLAHILMSGAHGDRPVTLVGYSMGARLIFHCLLELCRHSAKGDALFPLFCLVLYVCNRLYGNACLSSYRHLNFIVRLPSALPQEALAV